jgi:hypothetical protein
MQIYLLTSARVVFDDDHEGPLFEIAPQPSILASTLCLGPNVREIAFEEDNRLQSTYKDGFNLEEMDMRSLATTILNSYKARYVILVNVF